MYSVLSFQSFTAFEFEDVEDAKKVFGLLSKAKVVDSLSSIEVGHDHDDCYRQRQDENPRIKLELFNKSALSTADYEALKAAFKRKSKEETKQ